MAPVLSVIVPTYNEAANVGPLLGELRRALAGLDVEFVVVDDDSKDGTAEKARQAEPTARVIVRKGERGLATAVLRGLQEARGTFAAVMDADFQHPPAAVRAMLDRALATQADLVVASRYAAGGSEGTFGAVRRTISHGARTIAKAALPPVRKWHLTDPMSGLFLVRRDRIPASGLQPRGYKILLEILGRCDLRRVEEVGYRFQDRRGGASKLGSAVIWQYLVHVLGLGLRHPDNTRLWRFMAVGASGVVVNLGLLFVLHQVFGFEATLAVLVAAETSILTNFLLNDAFTFQDRRGAPFASRLGMFHVVSLGALAANLLAFFVLHYLLGWNYLLAEFLAIVLAFAVNYRGNLRLTYAARPVPTRSWLPIVLLVVASGGLYFTALDSVADHYFDESYYLAVAHQIDNGMWMDPCTNHGADLEPVPLNYEHPPLAKLILAASVHAYDTYHGVFMGCRDPDSTAVSSTACFTETQLSTSTQVSGTVTSTTVSTVTTTESVGKDCFQGWTHAMRACGEKEASQPPVPCGNPYAWRGPSALMGVTAVAFAALAARRLFGSTAAGVMAGSFVLLDNLMLTSSRLAILDIFAAGFTVVAIYCATFPTRRGVILSALFLGLGFSCKFYVLFAGPPVLLLSLWVHHDAGVLRRRRFDLHLLAFPLVPVLVFLATYTPWLVQWAQARGPGWAVGHFIAVQAAAFKWDTMGVQTHQYLSPPSQWLALQTPMNYLHSYTTYNPGTPQEYTLYRDIIAVGNPILWWGATIAVISVLVGLASSIAVRLRRNPPAVPLALPAAGAAPATSLAPSPTGTAPLVEPPARAPAGAPPAPVTGAASAVPQRFGELAKLGYVVPASAAPSAPGGAAPPPRGRQISGAHATAGGLALLAGIVALLAAVSAISFGQGDTHSLLGRAQVLVQFATAAAEFTLAFLLLVAGRGAPAQVVLSAVLPIVGIAFMVMTDSGLGAILLIQLVSHAIILAALAGKAFLALPRHRQALLFGALLPLMAYLGFFALHAGGRSMFIFYMTLIVPLMAIALAGALSDLWRQGGILRVAALASCGLVALAFLWFLPVSLYVELPRDGFMWRQMGDTPFYYPAFGFHDIMRVIPWMHECGNKVVNGLYRCAP